LRVLLTGAAGFLGSHLADRLVAAGHDVVGVDNLSSGRLTNLRQLVEVPTFSFVQADVCEPLDVEGSFEWVLHFASPASPPQFLAWPVQTLRTNGEGTRHLLDLARDRGAHFLLASTSEVYGDPLEHPQAESYWGNVHPTGPRSSYDEGKRYAEAMATAFHTAHGLPIRICRIFNTYGPRMRPDDGRVVSNFVIQALRGEPLTIYGDGSRTRSFTYVDDLIDGVMSLMAVETFEPVNLGNPNEFTILELARTVLRLTGSASTIVHRPLPEDDPARRRPDIGRARQLLGWQPRIGLEEGLRRMIDAYRADELDGRAGDHLEATWPARA